MREANRAIRTSSLVISTIYFFLLKRDRKTEVGTVQTSTWEVNERRFELWSWSTWLITANNERKLHRTLASNKKIYNTRLDSIGEAWVELINERGWGGRSYRRWQVASNSKVTVSDEGWVIERKGEPLFTFHRSPVWLLEVWEEDRISIRWPVINRGHNRW